MAILNYDEYMKIVPEETRDFVMRFLNFMKNSAEIRIDGYEITSKNNLLLIKALLAYSDSNEKNANIAKTAGYNYPGTYWSNGSDESSRKKIFTEYYTALAPYKNIEDYYTLTPEEILRNIYTKVLDGYVGYPLSDIFRNEPETFFKRLYKPSQKKKELMMSEIRQSFNKDYPIDVVNYFDTAARILSCLKEDNSKNKIERFEITEDSLTRLAMVLAAFVYNSVITKEGVPTDQEVIVAYLEKNGITLEEIENHLNIKLEDYDLESVDPTLLLAKDLSKNFLSGTSKSYTTVSKLFSAIALNTSDINNLPVVTLLSYLSGRELRSSDFDTFYKEEKDKPNESSLNDLLKNLMPNVLTFIKRVIRVHTYLESVQETLDKKYIQTDKDLQLAAILLVSYGYKNNYRDYFEAKGMTFEKVLELLDLPSKTEYFEALKAITIDKRKALLFKDYITSGYNYSKSREQVTPDTIIFNIDDKGRTKSPLVHKLFFTASGIQLSDCFQGNVKEYTDQKEKDRRTALTESLLGGLSIEVYNFLKVVSNCYIALENKGLDEVDREQLAIIFAGIKHDKRLCNYLYNIGITEGNLPDRFGINYTYYDKAFDIDIINDHFKPYIFDRKPEEITMYTIFENAFNPALKNSINLRKALFSYNKKPEDFVGVKAKVEAQEKEIEKKEQINRLFNKLDDWARPIVQTAFNIHFYLCENIDKIPIITTIEDVKELAMLIGVLYTADAYKPFFANNGITFEDVLKLINLDLDTFKKLNERQEDRTLSLVYEKYLTKAKKPEDIIEALFSDFVNNSQVIENITAASGNDYTYLVAEVKTKKERALTPEEGIEILSAEEVKALDNLSFSSVISYGTNISRHSKYISDALQQLVFADSLEHSTEELNKLLEDISYTEEVPSEEKQGFFSRLFALEEPTKTVKKYDPTKIENMGPEIDIQATTLSKELRGYDALKKYIEVYLVKLTQYLEEMKRNYAILEAQEIDESLDEITKFARTLDKNSALEILRDKIQSFETIILLMKQELVTVHRAIINHFLAVNSLQTSKMAILPLISSEMAITAGNETEGEALRLTGELVNLLQNVVNKNAEGTRENLTRLKSSSISEETYQALNAQVNSYLDSVDRGQKLLTTQLTLPKPNVIDVPVIDDDDDEPTPGTSGPIGMKISF